MLKFTKLRERSQAIRKSYYVALRVSGENPTSIEVLRKTTSTGEYFVEVFLMPKIPEMPFELPQDKKKRLVMVLAKMVGNIIRKESNEVKR